MLTSVLLSGGPLVWRGDWSNTKTMATMFVEVASLTTAVTYMVKGVAGSQDAQKKRPVSSCASSDIISRFQGGSNTSSTSTASTLGTCDTRF